MRLFKTKPEPRNYVVNSFEPDAKLKDGRSVRVVGPRFKIYPSGRVWFAVEFPDRMLRPVLVEDLEPLQEPMR